MSIDQIEEAIQKLPATEREALESRLIARRCGLDALSENERAELLSSLDEAEREIDEGRTYNGDQLSPGRAFMAWKVIFSARSKTDLEEIVNYIASWTGIVAGICLRTELTAG